MKNFQVTDKDTNNTYWISRAMAVCAIVLVKDQDGNKFILINQRGEGVPDYKHHWNIPCGYLDWDETTSEACTREVLEECNVYIEPTKWKQFGEIDDAVTSNRQNVTIRKIAIINWEEYEHACWAGHRYEYCVKGEENEVEGIELMPLTDYNINEHKWAFNHKALINKIMNDNQL